MRPKKYQTHNVKLSDAQLLKVKQPLTVQAGTVTTVDRDARGTVRISSRKAGKTLAMPDAPVFIPPEGVQSGEQWLEEVAGGYRVHVSYFLPVATAAKEAIAVNELHQRARTIVQWLNQKNQTILNPLPMGKQQVEFVARAMEAGILPDYWPTYGAKEAARDAFIEWANKQPDYLAAKQAQEDARKSEDTLKAARDSARRGAIAALAARHQTIPAGYLTAILEGADKYPSDEQFKSKLQEFCAKQGIKAHLDSLIPDVRAAAAAITEAEQANQTVA